MRAAWLFASIASMALVTPSLAKAGPDPSDKTGEKPEAATEAKAPQSAPEQKPQQKALFSTGVAKGRDLLDSAISTSALSEAEVTRIGARTLGEALRSVPGLRVESTGDMPGTSYTIRGLPLTGLGSKYVQFQEDGLPVLELGDLKFFTPGALVQLDLTLSRIESIRGGSASTFASNSPGGVINFISRTGEEEGGSIMLTAGLGYGEHRVDFEYGGRLSKSLRFNVGGYYREGSGPRDPGYTAFKGGQVKLNVTREFENGYVRAYLKLLDDRTPIYLESPVLISGTNANPSYSAVTNFDSRHQVLSSNNSRAFSALNGDGNVVNYDMAEGAHPVSKALGLEARFDVAGWTFTDRLRYSSTKTTAAFSVDPFMAPANTLALILGGPGATLSYANGPKKGQAITSPSTLNGNGLLSYNLQVFINYPDAGNFVNDFRGTRVWKLGKGDLTVTGGVYKSVQQVKYDSMTNSALREVNGSGAALINVTTAGGTAVTTDGKIAFGQYPLGVGYPSRQDVQYDVTAPYGSVNYHIGKLAIGGSVRYDIGKVNGQLYGAALGGGRIGMTSYDLNKDGVISAAEMHVGIIPITNPLALNYDYNYASYSVGVNYRIAPSLAVFARYSRGARATGDSIYFTSTINSQTGGLNDPADAYGIVKQSEVGVKYRQGDLALNLTTFLADARDTNFQLVSNPQGVVVQEQIDRNYRAYGAEFEGNYSRGPWSLTVAGTYTHSEIRSDKYNPQYNGNTPRHQPKLIAQVTPAYDAKFFSVGGTVIYTGSSYSQDANLLKMPTYTTVNAFVQVRPVDRVEVMVTASNLFDTLALAAVNQSAIPASGIGTASVMNGRTVAASLRFRF